MSKKYLEIPNDFSPEIYRFLNPDLPKYNNTECILHYIIKGFFENRKYKLTNELPEDFCTKMYVYYNPDLDGMPEQRLKIHYLKHGIKENRVYKVDLPEDFDVEIYSLLNKDITNLPHGWLKMHYFQHGKKEGRKYSDTFFDKDFFIKENNIENYQGYQDYLKDIRQVKSAVVKEKINNLPDFSDNLLLVSHENSIYGATHYLYIIYNKLKNLGIKVKIIDCNVNPILVQKYNVSKEDIFFYEKDATLLYYICTKTNPKKIYFNSVNSEMAMITKYLQVDKLIIHSHEVREHYLGDIAPTFVVSQRIADQYDENILVQAPIISQEILDLMDYEFSKKVELSNKFGQFDSSKITLGMCGNLSDRKNYKLFLEIAEKLNQFNFVWIGGQETVGENIPNFYHIKSVDLPYKYYNVLDYFILFSVVDPCPYVVLENLYLGNNVLTFKDNIYTNHKCKLLKDIYFEFDGEINEQNAISFIKEKCLLKTNRQNKNGKKYIEENFVQLKQQLISYL